MTYKTVTQLNPVTSGYTGSMVCFAGECIGRNGKMEKWEFVEIADCHSKVRIHQDMSDNHAAWVIKIETMRDALQDYIEFLRG